jgi:hypothetical protein
MTLLLILLYCLGKHWKLFYYCTIMIRIQTPGIGAHTWNFPLCICLIFRTEFLGTIAFEIRPEDSNYGSRKVMLLTRPLFNHSDVSNVAAVWDRTLGKMVFRSKRTIKKGEELEINYLPCYGKEDRAERLRTDYGISSSLGETRLECLESGK